jgi:N-acetylglutamate synthase-like GNAT family acetyltransferase
MKIINITEQLEPQYFVCLEEWNKELAEVKAIKEKWYREMKEKGLKVRIALMDNNVTGGMIEYMPVEYSCVEGSRLYIINCIWVHGYEGKGYGNMQGRGIGTALLQSAEQDVKAMGMDGMAAWGISEKMWMNAPWFQKYGYEKVDQIDWFVLLWKPFHKDAVPPVWRKGEFTQVQVAGKVKVTAFFSGQCCSENSVYYSAKKAAREFGDKVIFEEIDMSKEENRKKYGFGWRLYINNENLFTAYPPSYQQIKVKIKEHLVRI